MTRLSQEMIEKLGIGYLNESLADVDDYVSYNANVNDKEPFTDGDMFFYDGKGKSKKHFTGRIHCQVKSTTSVRVQKYQKYYQLDRNTLSGFKKMGGVLLIVICLDKNSCKGIYYQRLTEIMLDKLLGTGKNKPAIVLSKFPLDVQRKRKVLKQIEFDLKDNIGHTLLKLKKAPKKVVIPGFLLDPNDFEKTMQNLENQEIIIYSKYNNQLQPVGTLTDEDVELLQYYTENDPVTFGHLGTFPVQMLIKKRKHGEVKLFFTGAESKLTISIIRIGENRNKVTLTANKTENIESQIKNVEIMKYLINSPIIQIKNWSFDLTSSFIDADKKSEIIESWIQFLKIQNDLSKKLNIDFYKEAIDQDAISTFNDIVAFISSRNSLGRKEAKPRVFKFNNRYIGIVLTKENYWNFFDKELKQYFAIKGASNSAPSKFYLLNPYMLADTFGYPIQDFYGYNFKIIYDWFNQHNNELSAPVTLNQVNSYCELLIHLSLQDNDNRKLYLEQAERLLQLVKTIPNERLYFNHIQLQRRLGKKLSINDIEKLIHFAKAGNNFEKLCANHLLNASFDEKSLYTQLTEEQQEQLDHSNILN